MPGPAPKPASKRRRYAKPKSYGAAEPTTVPAAASSGAARELGFDNPHPLIAQMWETVQHSCESAFYSDGDWDRLRLELWFASRTMANPRLSSAAWEAVQRGLSELLISPAVKRRAGIELRRNDVDADEVAAVSMTAGYQQRLQSLKSV